MVVYPFTEKFPLESKWNAAFWVVPAENLWEQWNIWKGSPVLPDGMFQTENCVPFLQGHVDTSIRPSRSFSGKRNWFAQMVNAIPGRNLPVPNFAYHLPKLWTDWFVHVNGKQPLSYFTNYLRPLANNLRECYGTRLSGSFQRKICGSNGTSEKVVLFFRTECSKRKIVFRFFKAMLIPVSGLRGRFPVKGTDLHKW